MALRPSGDLRADVFALLAITGMMVGLAFGLMSLLVGAAAALGGRCLPHPACL
jgi:hypothetical protein